MDVFLRKQFLPSGLMDDVDYEIMGSFFEDMRMGITMLFSSSLFFYQL